MDDQGEKIVFLARELLNAGAPETINRKKSLNFTMTFKTLCLTTVLAASAGGLVTEWAHEHNRPLNKYERVELQALVFYASKIQGIDEDKLRREVEKETGIFRFDDMTTSDFPLVRRYLQEKAQ